LLDSAVEKYERLVVNQEQEIRSQKQQMATFEMDKKAAVESMKRLKAADDKNVKKLEALNQSECEHVQEIHGLKSESKRWQNQVKASNSHLERKSADIKRVEEKLAASEKQCTKLQGQLKAAEDSKERVKGMLNEEKRTTAGLRQMKQEKADVDNSKIEGVRRTAEAERKKLEKQVNDLEKEVKDLKKSNGRNISLVETCKTLIQGLAPIRQRWMFSCLPLLCNTFETEKEAGNKAAHMSNAVLDATLFKINFLKDKDQEHFLRIYGITLQDFEDRYAQHPKLVELVNFRGAMSGFFSFGARTLSDTIDQNFKVAERRCKSILGELRKRHDDEDKAGKAYSVDPRIAEQHQIMQGYVNEVRELHRNSTRNRTT
jgi:myosin heavy subunit